MTEEITGLASAIEYAGGSADNAQQAATAIEGAIGDLQAYGTSEAAVTSLTAARDAFWAAAEALRDAERVLTEYTAVREAYNATGGDAGGKAFVTTEGKHVDIDQDAADQQHRAAVDRAIRQAYDMALILAEEDGQLVRWIGLVELRAELVHAARHAGHEPYSRADVDAGLQRISREPGVHVQAEANQQTLTEADHEAAVTFGNSARHILMIEED